MKQNNGKMNLTEQWKNRFEKMWHLNDQAKYRQGSAGQRYAPQFLAYVPQGVTINEYGSGTGRAVIEIKKLRPDVKINMVDIASNALESEAAALIGPDVNYYIGDLAALPDDFPIATWGYCIGVLMLVAPETLDDILAEICRTCRNLFVEVYNLSDVRCDIELTTIKQDSPWWLEKLREHWPNVEFIQSKEHRQRFVFVCRGENE
jgi:SAM-dependent methyltransferase